MNIFDQTMSAAVVATEPMIGTSFKLDKRPDPYAGNIDRHRKGTKLGLGGVLVEYDSILECSLPQFVGQPPATGTAVAIDGFIYVIVEIDIDGSSIRLYLKGKSQ